MSRVRVAREEADLLRAVRDKVEDLTVLARALGPFLWLEEEWVTKVSMALKDLTGRTLFGDNGWLEEPAMKSLDSEYDLIGFLRDRFDARLEEIEQGLTALLWPKSEKAASTG